MEEPRERIGADLRIALPNHALFVGASQSGKTTLCLNLLSKLELFQPKPARILFFYDQFQGSYAKLKLSLEKQGVVFELFKGFSVPKLDELAKAPDEGQTIILVDDFSEESSASQELARIATNGRHKNVSLWLIWHQLFSRHPASRTIAQNVRYYFFLPSIRLESQLRCLGSQLNMRSLLLAAFRRCVDSEQSCRYLLLDCGPGVPSCLRLRTGVDNLEQQYCFF